MSDTVQGPASDQPRNERRKKKIRIKVKQRIKKKPSKKFSFKKLTELSPRATNIILLLLGILFLYSLYIIVVAFNTNKLP